jgi:cell division protein FtsW (lipid II flippase)
MNLRSLRLADPAEVRRRFGVAAFLVPIAVAVVGCAFMALGCVPMATWGLHALALLPALAVGLGASRVRRVARVAPLAAAASFLALAATLVAPGIQGVHRWLDLGPLALQPSAILAPVVVAGLGFLAAAGRWAGFAALLAAAQAIHVAQPDAGQAFAVGLGALAAALLAPGRRGVRAAAALLAVAGPIAAALPLDPLAPVRHVEGILALAAARGLAFAILARLFVAVLPLPALIGALHAAASRERTATAAAAALGAYEVGAVLATRLGAFPVPVLGFGASHLVGFFLANGLLVAIVHGLPLPAPTVAAPPAGEGTPAAS